MFLLIYVTVNIKTHPVARMQAWRRLRHWSMLSSLMLCYTPTHASNRKDNDQQNLFKNDNVILQGI